MALAQRFYKISGQCFLMDADNTLMFPSAQDFQLIKTYRNEDFNYTTFGFENFTHPRRGSWSGEVNISDSSLEPWWFAERTNGEISTATAGIQFEEMELGTVVAGPTINLDYAPLTDANALLQIFQESSTEDEVGGLAAADPNTYSIAGNVITMAPSTVVGDTFRINYWRATATASKIEWSPYTQPSAFKLYSAKAIVWAATGVKYWATIFARSCVPTGDFRFATGDQTLAFNINNVVINDLRMYRSMINEV